MRIGVGRTEELRDTVLLDVAAARVATECDAAVRRSLGILNGMRFRDSLVDLALKTVPSTPAGEGELQVLEGGTLDTVSTAAWAEVGLMSKALLSIAETDIDIVGASMSVIASKTVCSFVLRPGDGERAKIALRDVCKWDHLHVSQNLLSPQQAEFYPYWLDWCVPDEPGAFLRILDAFEQAVEEVAPKTAMNVEYGLTRALWGRQQFAGKACLSGPELEVVDLASRLNKSLGRSRPEWVGRITLSSEELSARPWTSLDLFDKFGGAADSLKASAIPTLVDDVSIIDLRTTSSDVEADPELA